MPIIPATRNLPDQIDIISGAVAPYRALNKIAGDIREVGEIVQRVEDAEDDVKVAEFSTLVTTTLNKTLRDQTIREPYELEEKYNQAKLDTKQALASLPGSSRLKQKARIAYDGIIRTNDDNYQGALNKLRVDSGRASVERSRGDLLELYRMGEVDHTTAMMSYNALLSRGFHSKQEQVDFAGKFENLLLRERIGRDPVGFLTEVDQGAFNHLGENIYPLREEARRLMERDEMRQEKTFTAVREVVERAWASAANTGSLRDSDIEDALRGNNPYVSPEKAREYLRVNSEPPSVGGNAEQVRAIMFEYHSGPSSFDRIARAREQLKHLSRSGKVSPLIDKAFNELQTDERTMTGIQAQQVNRAIQAAEDSYEATTPPLPFSSPLFSNRRKQDKAKLRDAIRRGQNPKELLQQKAVEQKQRIEVIPEKHKKVLELLK